MGHRLHGSHEAWGLQIGARCEESPWFLVSGFGSAGLPWRQSLKRKKNGFGVMLGRNRVIADETLNLLRYRQPFFVILEPIESPFEELFNAPSSDS